MRAPVAAQHSFASQFIAQIAINGFPEGILRLYASKEEIEEVVLKYKIFPLEWD